MAKFCSQCGRPLKEGEVCDCKKEGAASGAEQRQPEQKRLSTVSVGQLIQKRKAVLRGNYFFFKHNFTQPGKCSG